MKIALAVVVMGLSSFCAAQDLFGPNLSAAPPTRPVPGCPPQEYCALARFSGDGKRLVTLSRQGLSVWEPASGLPPRKVPLSGGDIEAKKGAVSHDGRFLALLNEKSRTVTVYDLETGAKLGQRSHAGLGAGGMGPGIVASGEPKKWIELWDARTGRVVGTLRGSPETAVFSPDGKRLAFHSLKAGASVCEVPRGLPCVDLADSALVDAAFLPDGSGLLAKSSNLMRFFFELSNSSATLKYMMVDHGTEWGTRSAASLDGRWLAVVRGDVTIHDAATGFPVYAIPQARLFPIPTFSEDGALLLDGHTPILYELAPVMLSVRLARAGEAALRDAEKQTSKIVAERDERTAALDKKSVKGEFETQAEHERRSAALASERKAVVEDAQAALDAIAGGGAAAAAEEPVRAEIARFEAEEKTDPLEAQLKEYDADAGTFAAEALFDGATRAFTIAVPRAEAAAVRQRGIVAQAAWSWTILPKVERRLRRVVFSDSKLGELSRWQDGRVASAPKAGAPAEKPARLAATVSFEDNGDGVLSAEESAKLVVKVANTGEGAARGVVLAVDGPLPAGLAGGSQVFLGDVAAGASREGRLTLRALPAAADGEASVIVVAREGRGFDAAPTRVRFPVRGFRAPKLELSEWGVKDADGDSKPETGELCELTVRVVNRGQGAASAAVVSLAGLDGDAFVQGERQAKLGALKPGQSADAVFTVVANMRFTKPAMKFTATISDTGGRFGGAFPVEIAVNKAARAMGEVVVSERAGAAGDANPALRVDVDDDIPAGAAANPDAIAVVLGIESYKRVSPVNYARRDAAVFKDYAVKVLGVTDDRNHIFHAIDDVTLGELRKVFSPGGWLSRRVKPGSDVYIYYAGHGAPDLATKGAFLIPEDGDPNYPKETGFALSELNAFVNGLGGRSVTVFLDACFSGADRESKMLLAGARPLMLKTSTQITAGPNVAVLTASSGEQISSSLPEKRHGLFTYHLLKGLRGEADANKDGVLGLGELHRYVKERVSNGAAAMDREQSPTLAGESARTLVRFK